VTALRLRPAAERDVDATADYYASEGDPDVALRFLNAVEEAFRHIVAFPEAGSPVSTFNPRLAGLRFWPVSGFERHLVFYVSEPKRVDVLRVLHGARDLVVELEGKGSGQEPAT
jgi:toxin ParE1/3/4